MKLIFCESLDRDIWNWQTAVMATSYGIDWKKFLPEGVTVENVGDKKFLRQYLEKEFYDTRKVSDFKQWLEKNVLGNQVEGDLISLMQKPLRSESVKIYLTTFHRAPYDPDEPSLFLFDRSPRERCATTIYHEIMHFLFHWYYWEQCEAAGFSNQEIHDLKESLTVLLNPILKKRNLPLDNGYPMHQELRKKWTALYEENPNFPVFLEKAIPLYEESLAK